MKKLFIVLILFSIFINGICQDKKNYPITRNPNMPDGAVWFPINYCDYITNGNNLRRLIAIGDTIIIAADINPDKSGPPPSDTVSRVYYQVSFDGGSTWLTDAISTNSIATNRFPNLLPIYRYDFARSIVITGRQYVSNNAANQKGIAIVEAMLRVGSFTPYPLPSGFGRDFVGANKSYNISGGITTSPSNSNGVNDTLWYLDFNYLTGVYGTPKKIAENLDSNYRFGCEIASNGLNITAVRFKSTNYLSPQAYYVHESTNGGSNWSAGTMVGNAGLYNGDSCVAASSFDIIYKPGTTQKCLAFATLSPSNTRTKGGCKILFWSPTINSGIPVVVYDYSGTDTSVWNRFKSNIQFGMTPLSHPSLAYSDDGSVLYCAFSAIRTDTSAYSTGKNFHRNKIILRTSANGGLTWKTPYYNEFVYVSRDLTYPTLSKSGNSGNFLRFIYNNSRNPGSFTYKDNAPADTVYTIFKSVQVFTEVRNIETEIPSKYLLAQNYPNPFNPATNIRYQIPKSKFITLKIYDLLGKEVSTPINFKQQPGTYEVDFNGEKLPSGVYIYVLYADGNLIDAKKMILLK